jgi:aryl-alcohol dehydrogenase-like predicted oxidoreductase
MQYVRLGSSGLKVSRVCVGCMSFGNAEEWMIEKEEAKKVVDKAIDLGINFFDTANRYSMGRSEEIVGELLQGRREDIVLATKVGLPVGSGVQDKGLSRRHILQQIDLSLKRLRTNHVDLYQIHRWDYETPIEETLSTLSNLVLQGKTRYIGASSMWAWQFSKSMYLSESKGYEKFVSMQNHYNLIYREEEREMIPLCVDLKVGVITWSPLARGFLTGKYRRDEKIETARLKSDKYLSERYFRPEDFEVVERVTELAKSKGVTNAQIALAWLFSKDFVTAPIVGMSKTEHVEDAVQALELKLSSEEQKYLEEAYKPHPVLGHS